MEKRTAAPIHHTGTMGNTPTKKVESKPIDSFEAEADGYLKQAKDESSTAQYDKACATYRLSDKFLTDDEYKRRYLHVLAEKAKVLVNNGWREHSTYYFEAATFAKDIGAADEVLKLFEQSEQKQHSGRCYWETQHGRDTRYNWKATELLEATTRIALKGKFSWKTKMELAKRACNYRHTFLASDPGDIYELTISFLIRESVKYHQQAIHLIQMENDHELLKSSTRYENQVGILLLWLTLACQKVKSDFSLLSAGRTMQEELSSAVRDVRGLSESPWHARCQELIKATSSQDMKLVVDELSRMDYQKLRPCYVKLVDDLLPQIAIAKAQPLPLPTVVTTPSASRKCNKPSVGPAYSLSSPITTTTTTASVPSTYQKCVKPLVDPAYSLSSPLAAASSTDQKKLRLPPIKSTTVVVDSLSGASLDVSSSSLTIEPPTAPPLHLLTHPPTTPDDLPPPYS